MSIHMNRKAIVGRLPGRFGILVLVGGCFLLGAGIAAGYRYSDRYSMELDPSGKERVGEQTFNDVKAFFDEAERAIETKNLKTLMSLYSENYSDGQHDKNSAEQIWQRIFATFDTMATHHNMGFVNTSAEKNVAILLCSGLLLGIPKGEERAITIDNWNQQEHVLVKEAGKWTLIGTYGRARKRLWFDKPMHPLF